jgi:hypothetical protein
MERNYVFMTQSPPYDQLPKQLWTIEIFEVIINQHTNVVIYAVRMHS